MARKKTEKPAMSPADEELVEKVDAMMGSEPADGTPKATTKPSKSDPVKIVSVSSQVGAPELPADLLKKIKTDDDDGQPPPEKVLKIDSKIDNKPAAAKTKSTAQAVPVRVVTNKPAVQETTEPQEPQEIKIEEPDQPEAAPEPTIDLEDGETDKAVDEIVANEGDTMLALEDLKSQREAEAATIKPKGFGWRGVFYLIVLAIVIAVVLIGYGYTRM